MLVWKSVVFSDFARGVLAHAQWSETVWYPEVCNSLLVIWCKSYRNRLIFAKVIAASLLARFVDHSVHICSFFCLLFVCLTVFHVLSTFMMNKGYILVLTATRHAESGTSKTAKKSWTVILLEPHVNIGEVLLNYYHRSWFLPFPTCHFLHVVVNTCINCSFVHLHRV